MTDRATSDLWWKNAIIYCVDTKVYLDTDGDGWGDLAGLTRRLDYLRDLGVDCLWLAPCYPSPMRDDGYDVTDYYTVDPRLGTLGDFVELIRTAHALGLRVIMDLVVNHTSDRHPWFRAARADRDAPERRRYLWADQPQPDPHGVVFPGEQRETWTYDEAAGQFFFHRYHEFQPDLAIGEPAVRDELTKVIGFWLELGVDGFRVDSLPFLVDKMRSAGGADPYEFLRDLRAFMARRRGDAVLLGEANVPQDEQRPYFGDPSCGHDASGVDMLFDFAVQANVWAGLATGSAEPVARALRGRLAAPEDCQYAVFVRHHDELTLEIAVAEADRRAVFDTFDPDGAGLIYDRGLRRRLAPLLGGDRRRIRLLLSLLLALPGAPVLLYGDEIGMGDDLELDGRLAVRLPMQWSAREHGGFSTAPVDALVRRPLAGGGFGYRAVNVADQLRDPDSQLAFTREAIRTRRACPEIGWGDWRVIDTGEPRALVLRHEWREGRVLTVHNLSAEPVEAKLDAAVAEPGPLREILADRDYPDPSGTRRALPVGGYGFRWLRVGDGGHTCPG